MIGLLKTWYDARGDKTAIQDSGAVRQYANSALAVAAGFSSMRRSYAHAPYQRHCCSMKPMDGVRQAYYERNAAKEEQGSDHRCQGASGSQRPASFATQGTK